jgi:hypothetical protein
MVRHPQENATAHLNGSYAAAERYLHAGLTPVALMPGGKFPSIPWKAYQDRQPTADELRGMFSADSNVGIILGTIVRIDVDGDAGQRLLADICGEMPATVEFTTPSGGHGFLFRVPNGVKIKTTVKKAECVGGHQELRFQARGALTVMPPSKSVQGDWRFVSGRAFGEVEIAELPAKLVDLMRVKDDKPPRNRTAQPASDDISVAMSALASLKSSRADEYDAWLQVGMALHTVSESLLGAWTSWSSQSNKFSEGECAKKWRSFSAGTDGVTIGSLIKWAKDDSPGWAPPQRRRRDNAKQTPGVPPGPVPTPAPGIDAQPQLVSAVILRYMLSRFEPTFRRGDRIWSGKLNREVARGELCQCPTTDIIPDLMIAADFPRDKHGPDRSKVPSIYRQWAGFAYADLLQTLPEEPETAEIADGAAEQFEGLVADALMSVEAFGRSYRDGESDASKVERRSLIEWCKIFAKPGNWQSVRSLKLWCRLDDKHRLQVAIHQRLFGQIRRPMPHTHRKFAALCESYGVGTAGRTSRSVFVELTGDFIADLLTGPCDGRCDGVSDATPSHAHAKGAASQVPSHAPSHAGGEHIAHTEDHH